MKIVTLSTLRQLVVDECDLDEPSSNTHVTTQMLNRWVNLAIGKLTGILAELYDDDWNTTIATLQTSAGVATVALPTLCYRLKSLIWVKESDHKILLRRASPDDLLDGGLSPSDPQEWQAAPRYQLHAQTATFVPVPSAVYDLRIIYTQILADLSSDSDTVELGSDWDDFLIYEVARRVYVRREMSSNRDYAFAMARDAEQRIRDSAAGRDENEPRFVRRLHGRVESTREAYDRLTFEDR